MNQSHFENALHSYQSNAAQLGALNGAQLGASLGSLLQGQRYPMFDGRKPIVVCGGEAKEAKDLDEAQAIAESLAHSKSADAYILKPVRKVAPKRDVVTTDL